MKKENEEDGDVEFKDKSTITEQKMQDIVRLDLTTEISEFNNHIQNKIERLDERMRFVNYKFEDVRYWFKRYSISIIYFATTLTLVEAFLNSTDLECEGDEIQKNLLQVLPLVLSSLVSLIAAIIKFNKYEEKIEDITRATEKCIITISKLKEVKEELYFCKTVDSFIKINDRFTRDIYTEYLESNTNIERQLLDTDYAKYMKKLANNDVERAKILLERNKSLDDLGEDTINKFLNSKILTIKKKSKENIKERTSTRLYSEKSDFDCKKFSRNTPRMSISAQHNNVKRPIPYRGISPPPLRPNIYNKKMTPYRCPRCDRNYLCEVTNQAPICPYCKTPNNINSSSYSYPNSKSSYSYSYPNTNAKPSLDNKLANLDNLRLNFNENITNEIVETDSCSKELVDIERGISPRKDEDKIADYVNCIQKQWREYKVRKSENSTSF